MNPQTSRCPTAEAVARFVTGDLEPDQIEALAHHVEFCPACQDRLEALDQEEVSVDRLMHSNEPLPYADESDCDHMISAIVGAQGRIPRPAPATRAPAVQSQAPRRLGDYELLERLGEGGMGTVYRARHITLGTTAAVKLLHPHRQADRATIERFEREMVALGRLDHPHIVRALDAGEDAGLHYLAMEYVDGIDLARLVKVHGSLPVAEAAEAVRQAALGLSYVHHHGRVHRDIKPSNLILTQQGMVKLLDLGLARVEEYAIDEPAPLTDDILAASSVDLTRTHQIMGTLEYMAPEQAINSHAVDHLADLYALGATLYKLLTGDSSALRHLQLVGMRFTDEQFEELRRFLALRELDLSASIINDAQLLNVLPSLTDLQYLDLTGTAVTGEFLPSLRMLHDLVELQLDDTQLDARQLTALADLPALKRVLLTNTDVDEPAIENLRRLRPELEVKR